MLGVPAVLGALRVRRVSRANGAGEVRGSEKARGEWGGPGTRAAGGMGGSSGGGRTVRERWPDGSAGVAGGAAAGARGDGWRSGRGLAAVRGRPGQGCGRSAPTRLRRTGRPVPTGPGVCPTGQRRAV
ncbi:hypothetical protein GCM10010345_62880 [Streptomyces canarius]|uniref:Uncharacterized protein n=1 Tax=Streptomyces canarius TaxID=285453 RepID=A0ABQ3D290_9ACTN|nr:hypothetical protein GCM10010345_62880 [Streptomyces canarius]